MIPAGFTIHTPEDVLIFLSQDDRPLEDYVEEFLELSSLVSWGRLHQLDIKMMGVSPTLGFATSSFTICTPVAPKNYSQAQLHPA